MTLPPVPRKLTPTRAQAIGDAWERRERRDKARRVFQRAAQESRPAIAASRGVLARQRDGLVVAAYLAVRPDGRLVQLHLPGMPPGDMPVRGECEGMSEDSQRRLMLLLHSLRRDAVLPTMITLTFPEEFNVTADEAKACRKAWEKRVLRRFPKWCGIWRMEAHPEMSARLERVHPHFHLLTWGAWFDLKWVSRSWASVVWRVLDGRKRLASQPSLPGMPSVLAKAVKAGTRCERIRSWGGVLYSGKNYIAKAEEYPIGKAGRVWGYVHRKALPIAEERVIKLSNLEACAVRVAVEDWMRAKRIVSEHLICTFFTDDPSMFVAALMSRVRQTNPAT